MTPQLLTKEARAERQPAIGQRPMTFRRRRESAGTVCVWLLLTKPAGIRSGAAPGHEQSGGLVVPGEGLGQQAQRGLPSRPAYPPDEGLQ